MGTELGGVADIDLDTRAELEVLPPPEDQTPMERAILRRLDGITERLDDLGEALGRVESQTAEIPVMNENIQALRDHAGI